MLSSMVPVAVEEMEQRTRQEQQVRRQSQNVSPVLAQHEECDDDGKRRPHEQPGSLLNHVSTLLCRGWQYTHTGYMFQAMKSDVRGQVQKRIRRIAGQVAGIERMIEEDRYCVDVLLQVAAVRAALDGVGKLILRSHVETCVSEALVSGRSRDRTEKIDEIMEVFSKFSNVGSR
jgi:DNA-binding FrmR family transcriptional regulator